MQIPDLINRLSVLIMLEICSMEDIKNKQVPIKWPAGFAAEGILFWVFLYKQPIPQIFTVMIPGVIMLMLAYTSRGSIGTGDGILVTVTGIFLGTACTVRVCIYAVCLSAVWGMFLLVVKKKSRKYEMPFVPFLFLACMGDFIMGYCYAGK